jgi:hypothetical protein
MFTSHPPEYQIFITPINDKKAYQTKPTTHRLESGKSQSKLHNFLHISVSQGLLINSIYHIDWMPRHYFIRIFLS